MMSAMKQVVVLLMLVAIGTKAELGTENCGSLVSPKDQKVLGDWVLIESFSKSSEFDVMLRDVSSSHVELRLLPDNHIMTYIERSMYHNKTCTIYQSNLRMPTASDDHTLQAISPTLFIENGVTTELNETGTVNFYETCSDCLTLVYKAEMGDFVLIYRREGHHHDIDQLKATHGDRQKLAECLGIPHSNPFTYDKTADFCHKKSSPEETTE